MMPLGISLGVSDCIITLMIVVCLLLGKKNLAFEKDGQ